MRLKRDEMTVKGILGAARSALLLIIICSAVSYTVSDLLGDPSLLKAFLYGLAIWAGLRSQAQPQGWQQRQKRKRPRQRGELHRWLQPIGHDGRCASNHLRNLLWLRVRDTRSDTKVTMMLTTAKKKKMAVALLLLAAFSQGWLAPVVDNSGQLSSRMAISLQRLSRSPCFLAP